MDSGKQSTESAVRHVPPIDNNYHPIRPHLHDSVPSEAIRATSIAQNRLNASCGAGLQESQLTVADSTNHRLMVFDVAAITDGEPAVNVLGQLNFISGGSGITQGRMYSPRGVLIAASALASTTNIAYDYDPLYRLTAADYNGGATYFHYQYDSVGNLTRETTQAGHTDYVYDTAREASRSEA